ncbi:MAG: response regulator transcription factor, partial [Staphylococcus sp.]|nr:response regulator transcription factor [Staphylococcus sp.]
MMNEILIVDDEDRIRRLLKLYLERESFTIHEASDGREAYELAMENDYACILLDLMLPEMDGIEMSSKLREHKDTPIIMLTAKGDTFDKVLALEIGADDYIVKPFEPKELLARVKAVMRRYNYDEKDTELITLSDLTVDSASYNVVYKGEEIKMPPKEFELLHYLASNKNKVFTREQLLCEVWGYD